jgi:SPP1 gp7 family putative phage head morphogenesis protein
LASHEKKIETMMIGIWEEQRKIIISNLKKMKKTWLEKDAVDQILYPRKQFEVKIAKEIKPILESLMEERGSEELGKIGTELRRRQKEALTGIAFDVQNPNVQSWLNTYTPRFSNSLEAVSTSKLRTQLIEGMKLGEGIPQLTARINGTYANWNKFRSESIARSEAIRASNQGAIESYRQSGVVKSKVWITHIDKRTCPSCRRLDGKVIALEKNYFSKGDPAERITVGETTQTFKNDYEDITAPPRHTRCRCTIGANFYDMREGLAEPRDLYGDWKTNPAKYKKEHGAWFDKRGNVILSKKGTATHIPITDANHVKLATQDIGKMIHTHPHHLSFSGGDLAHAAAWDIGEMQILTSKGLYKIKPGIGSGGSWRFSFETIESEYVNIMNSLQSKYASRYTSLFNQGTSLAESQAISAAEHIDEVVKIISKKYNLSYSFTGG